MGWDDSPLLLLLYPSMSHSGTAVSLERWDFLPSAPFSLFACSSLLLGNGLPTLQKVSTLRSIFSTPTSCVWLIASVKWFSSHWFPVEASKAIAKYWDLKSWNFTATDPCVENAPWSAASANPRLTCDCASFPNNTCHVTHMWLLLLLVAVVVYLFIFKFFSYLVLF